MKLNKRDFQLIQGNKKQRNEEETYNQYIEWFNEHYITIRTKGLLQYKTKEGEVKYSYLNSSYNKKHRYCIHDKLILDHFLKKKTIGVFSGLQGGKFICFDIDVKNDMEKAKELARELIDFFLIDMAFEKEELLVSYSGNKGYHVEIFFNLPKKDKGESTNLIPNDKIRKFYQVVIEMMNVQTNFIELRPTPQQGVKLPLSIHRQTNKKCFLVDPLTLEEVSDDKLFTVQKVDFKRIEENLNEFIEVFDLKREVEVSNHKKESAQDNSPYKVSTFKEDFSEEKAIETLKRGHLTVPGTRHNQTLAMAVFLNTQGNDLDVISNTVCQIIEKTFDYHREILDPNWTKESLMKETKRIVNLTWDKEWKFAHPENPVFLSKEEILWTLQPNRIPARQMALVLLIHAKKYAKEDGIFSLTYDKQMHEMYGLPKNRQQNLFTIVELERLKMAEIIRRNHYAGKFMMIGNQKIPKKEANRYRILNLPHVNPNSKKMEVIDFHKRNYEQLIASFLSKDELLPFISKYQFKNKYQKFYSAKK